MTVLINGIVEVSANHRDAALAAATAALDEIRAQKGCRHYAWTADPTSPTRIYVYENWVSSDDLSAHLAGPCFGRMLGILGQYDILDTSITKYKVALEEPIFDPEGNPRGDFFTEALATS
ncbi:putative quinol monooxygenase [Microbulbifer sp. SA54]|uniref:putative quinol monooxygenase n=1 Tax=Microbulbifer sp. SA54 TaxID=3401577 RepID=UPI003AAC64B4